MASLTVTFWAWTTLPVAIAIYTGYKQCQGGYRHYDPRVKRESERQRLHRVLKERDGELRKTKTRAEAAERNGEYERRRRHAAEVSLAQSERARSKAEESAAESERAMRREHAWEKEVLVEEHKRHLAQLQREIEAHQPLDDIMAMLPF